MERYSLLARTHGQPASPTRMGKEIDVFIARLNQQLIQLKAIPFSAKFGGATVILMHILLLIQIRIG